MKATITAFLVAGILVICESQASAQACLPAGSGYEIAPCTAGETVASPTGHVISLAPAATNIVSVRIGDAALNGTVPVSVAGFGGAATPVVPAPAISSGIVTLSIPAASAVVQTVTIGVPGSPAVVLYALSLGGLPLGPSAVEKLTGDHLTLDGALFRLAGSINVPGTLQLSPTGASLRFDSGGTGALELQGQVDLSQSKPTFNAVLKGESGSLSIAGALSPGQPLALTSAASGKLTVGGIGVTLSEVSVKVSPFEVKGNAQLGMDLAHEGISLSGLRFDLANRIKLCDGKAGPITIAAPPSGILQGLSLTAESTQLSCDGSGDTLVDVTVRIKTAADDVGSAFPIRISRAGLKVGSTGSAVTVTSNKDVTFGGITSHLSKLTVNPGGPLSLTAAVSWAVPALRIELTPTPVTWTPSADPARALKCETGAIPATQGNQDLILTPLCAGSALDGVKLNGSLRLEALGQSFILNFNEVAIQRCETGALLNGAPTVAAQKVSLSFAGLAIDANGATVTATTGKCGEIGFALAVEEGDITSQGRHFARGKLHYTKLNINFKDNVGTVASLLPVKSDPFTLAGIGVSGITNARFDGTGEGQALTIDEVVLSLPEHLAAGRAHVTIDSHGNDIDDVATTADDLISFDAKKVAFKKSGVSVKSVGVRTKKICPAETAPSGTHGDEVEKFVEDWYQLPWFDVCFENDVSNTAGKGVALVQTSDTPLQLSLNGRIRMKKLVGQEQPFARFQAAYSQDVFALRARFNGAQLTVAGETMIVHTAAVRLEPKYRRIDAEVEIVSKELRSASIFLRHVGFEQIYEVEGTPRPFRVVKTSGWRTKPILDPDLPRTATSFATRYVPDLLAILGARLAGIKLW